MFSTLAGGLFYSIIQFFISYLSGIHKVSGPVLIMGYNSEQVGECYFEHNIHARGETDFKLINKQEHSSYPGALHQELTQDGRTAQGTTVVGSSRKASPRSSH